MLLILALLAPYTLWVYFLAVMNLERAQDAGTLPPITAQLGKLVLYPGYLLDVLLNLSLFSVLMLDLPREWTITSHINRLLTAPMPGGRIGRWQQLVCAFLCTNLLNPFDPSGTHCKARTLS